jgi:uncharacterized protein (TIGR03083 family)
MTDTPPYEDLLSLIDDRSAALREAAAAAPGFNGQVPGCPEWTLADLIAHVGGVQRVWAAAVSLADSSAPPSADQRGDLEPHGDLLEWSAESTEKLLAALRATAPDSPCWTWWAASGAPMTAAAVARHQVQEAAVHAYDAQETLGKPEPLPAAVAVDGVAEFLSVGMASMGPWPNRPARVVLTAVEGPSWTLDLSPVGARLNPPESGEPSTTVHAPAGDLVLALYGRTGFDGLRVDGDRSVLAEIKAWNDRE